MDKCGAKSEQTSYSILITKGRTITNPLLYKLIQNIIDRFPILREYVFGISG